MRNLLLLLGITVSSLVFSQANVNFSANPTVVCVGESIQFTDLTTSSNTITGWEWNFGNGDQSLVQHPNYTYSAPGTYNVTLLVYTTGGSTGTVKTGYITVNPLPAPSFNLGAVACSVPASPVISSVQPSAGGFTYAWDFGNTQTFNGINPTGISYTTPGNYTVTLEVTNSTTGCVNTTTRNINVVDYQAEFTTINDTFCAGQTVAFTNASSPGTNVWSWNFQDPPTSASQNPNHVFNTPGTYDVTLTASNTTLGCSDPVTHTITILPLPTPTFTVDPATGCAPLSVDFTNTTGLPGATYSWNFGNSTTSNLESPQDIIYSNNGSYNVSLTVTDQFGCMRTTTQNGAVVVAPLVPDFTADVLEGCETLTVQFTDNSSAPGAGDPITTWNWDFGNGNTFIGQNPPPQDFTEGEWDITLTVTTGNGCSDDTVKIEYIKVGTPLVIDFSFDPLNACAKTDTWTFTDLTVLPTADLTDYEWIWDYGDGTVIPGNQTATYNYPTAATPDTGSFTPALTIVYHGCSTTYTSPISTYANAPIVSFSLDQTLFCNPSSLPITVTATDNSIVGREYIPDDVRVTWNWGDGNIEVFDDDAAIYANNPGGTISHDFLAYGTYTVNMMIENFTTGCTDDQSVTVNVSFIDAGFDLPNDSTCILDPFSITSTANSSHPISTYTYTTGVLPNLSGPNHNYIYNTPGLYMINQTVTNNLGCSANISSPMTALALPQAQISPDVSVGCDPLLVTFSNTSTQGSGVPLSSFNWTFEDLSTQTTNDISETTQYTFTGEGSFTTSLIAIDEFGCESPSTSVITTLTKPTANFNVAPVVCNLTDFMATNASADYTSTEWFIDGSNTPDATTQNLTHQFADVPSSTNLSDDHTLRMIVTDVNGCKDTLDATMTVSMPYASFTHDLVTTNLECPPVTIAFEDSSSSVGAITSWNWNFGDGSQSTLTDPNNIYLLAGTYSTTLIATDEYGCTDDTVKVDYVTVGGPQADVTWIAVGDVCDPDYEFIPTNLVNVESIVWDLDDGTIVSDTTSFIHSYVSQGNYSPSVILSDNAGCSIPIALDPLSIGNDDLNAFFNVTPDTSEVGQPVVFDELSTGGAGSGIVTWEWDLATDQYTYSAPNDINYIYQVPGFHEVSLIVTDELGCKDTFALTILVTADVQVPNVFTVNGDGVNDKFTLMYDAFKSFNVVILNRWGNVMYDGKDLTGIELWDGYNLNGNLCEEGVYFYKLDGILQDDTEVSRHGFVTLWVGTK